MNPLTAFVFGFPLCLGAMQLAEWVGVPPGWELVVLLVASLGLLSFERERGRRGRQ